MPIHPLPENVFIPRTVIFLYNSGFCPAQFNHWPFSCRLMAGEIAKSNGARSGEYGGCCTDPKPRTPISSCVSAAVWEEALSMCNRKCSTGIPGRFFLRATTRSRRSTWFKIKYRLYIVSNLPSNFYIGIKIKHI